MQPLSTRTEHFTDSVIRRMTRVSAKYGAINLSQGFPDFPPPKAITDRLREVADEGPHQYSVTFGAENFREALARKQGRAYGRKINPDTEILVTCGGTEAMMSAMMTVCNPGDKVIVFSPFYENYGADTILSGAEPIYVPLHPPEFNFDPNELEDAFRQNPKALILCNPSNPCGKVFTREELTFIADLCKKYDAYCITDEVYEHIVYAPHEHVYMATLPGMFERTVTLNGFSKAFAMTGWRMGYACAPKEILDVMMRVHQYTIMCAPTAGQYAAVEALKSGLETDFADVKRMVRQYDRRRRVIVDGLRAAGLETHEPLGAFYAFPCVRSTGMTSQEFCVRLLEEERVACVPGDAFGETGEGYVRCSYASSLENITEAVRRIGAFTARHHG